MTVVLGSLLLSDSAKASCVPKPALRQNSHIIQHARRNRREPEPAGGPAVAAEQYMLLVHVPASAGIGPYNSMAYDDFAAIGLLYTKRRRWLALAPNPQRRPQDNRGNRRKAGDY